MNAITAVEKDGVTLNRYTDIFTEYSQPPHLRAGQCRTWPSFVVVRGPVPGMAELCRRARASAGHGRALSSCAGQCRAWPSFVVVRGPCGGWVRVDFAKRSAALGAAPRRGQVGRTAGRLILSVLRPDAFRYARNYLLQDSLTVRRAHSPVSLSFL
jgi:hypothetical protein